MKRSITFKVSICSLTVLPMALTCFSIVVKAQSAVAVANMRQALAIYSNATGVSDQDPAISAFAKSAAARMPQSGLADELTPTATLSYVGLAGLYCKALITSDAAKSSSSRRAHKQVDFNRTPAQISATVKTSVATEYAQMFWQRAATSAESTELTNLMTSISTGLTTAADTKTMFLAACTAAAASLSTIAH